MVDTRSTGRDRAPTRRAIENSLTSIINPVFQALKDQITSLGQAQGNPFAAIASINVQLRDNASPPGPQNIAVNIVPPPVQAGQAQQTHNQTQAQPQALPQIQRHSPHGESIALPDAIHRVNLEFRGRNPSGATQLMAEIQAMHDNIERTRNEDDMESASPGDPQRKSDKSPAPDGRDDDSKQGPRAAGDRPKGNQTRQMDKQSQRKLGPRESAERNKSAGGRSKGREDTDDEDSQDEDAMIDNAFTAAEAREMEEQDRRMAEQLQQNEYEQGFRDDHPEDDQARQAANPQRERGDDESDGSVKSAAGGAKKAEAGPAEHGNPEAEGSEHESGTPSADEDDSDGDFLDDEFVGLPINESPAAVERRYREYAELEAEEREYIASLRHGGGQGEGDDAEDRSEYEADPVKKGVSEKSKGQKPGEKQHHVKTDHPKPSSGNGNASNKRPKNEKPVSTSAERRQSTRRNAEETISSTQGNEQDHGVDAGSSTRQLRNRNSRTPRPQASNDTQETSTNGRNKKRGSGIYKVFEWTDEDPRKIFADDPAQIERDRRREQRQSRSQSVKPEEAEIEEAEADKTEAEEAEPEAVPATSKIGKRKIKRRLSPLPEEAIEVNGDELQHAVIPQSKDGAAKLLKKRTTRTEDTRTEQAQQADPRPRKQSKIDAYDQARPLATFEKTTTADAEPITFKNPFDSDSPEVEATMRDDDDVDDDSDANSRLGINGPGDVDFDEYNLEAPTRSDRSGASSPPDATEPAEAQTTHPESQRKRDSEDHQEKTAASKIIPSKELYDFSATRKDFDPDALRRSRSGQATSRLPAADKTHQQSRGGEGQRALGGTKGKKRKVEVPERSTTPEPDIEEEVDLPKPKKLKKNPQGKS